MRDLGRFLPKAVALLILTLVLSPASARGPAAPGSWSPTGPAPDRVDPGNYDIRVHGQALLPTLEQAYGRSGFEAMRAAGRQAVLSMQSSRQSAPGIEVRPSALVGAAEVVRNRGGRLTGPAPGRASTTTVLEFFRDHAGTYGLDRQPAAGLEALGESRSRSTGLRMVRVGQRVKGLPVFQGESRATLDRDGRLVATVGRLVPGIQEELVPAAEGLIPPEEAVRHALASVGIEVESARLHAREAADSPGALDVDSEDPRFSRPIHGERVYFPLAPGVVVPGWAQTTVLGGGNAWHTVVDGRTGILLFRKNLRQEASNRDARFSVYAGGDGRPIEGPAPGAPNHLNPGSGTQFPAVARTIVSMHAVRDPVASPDGWIPDSGSTTIGNNVDAFLDRDEDFADDPGALDSDGRPVGNPDASNKNRDFLGGAPRNFNYTPAPLGSNPNAGDDPSAAPYQRGVVTDLFYLANWYHDRLYGLGFDEAAGNLQNSNFGRGGKSKDPVEALAQIGADIGASDTAFSFWPPDGERGQIGFSLFFSPGPDRDSDLDAPVVLHELTHGLSGRILGNGVGLNWNPGLGMAEGWSDFYGLALIYDRPGDDPDAQYAFGGYSTYLMDRGLVPPGSFTDNYLYGLRRFPYSTDNGVNPLTLADADQATIDLSGGIAPAPFHWENFGASESHSLGEIWAEALWEIRSRIIAQHGSVPAGNQATLEIVTDALKLTPMDPGFIDGRDAILDADCAANACSHEEAIWNGFAERGLGYGAADSGSFGIQQGVSESFETPFLDRAGLMVSDPLGNGNGYPEPGETFNLTVSLVNPWRQAAKGVGSAQATLSSDASDAQVLTSTSSYGPIPPQGVASGTPFVVRLSGNLSCGRAVKLSLDVTSALGSKRIKFTLRAGRPSGAGAPLTFTSAISGGLPIPDGSFTGVIDPLAVNNDLDIADLDFRVDDLRHPFVGNLSLALRSPEGLMTDVIYRPGACTGTFCSQAVNSGDNFIGTRIDDASSRDLMTAGPSLAPFTGDWFPMLNSTFFDDPDPVRQLGRYNGRNADGTWKLIAGDHRVGNTGVLNSWSLIVTPVAYTCGP